MPLMMLTIKHFRNTKVVNIYYIYTIYIYMNIFIHIHSYMCVLFLWKSMKYINNWLNMQWQGKEFIIQYSFTACHGCNYLGTALRQKWINYCDTVRTTHTCCLYMVDTALYYCHFKYMLENKQKMYIFSLVLVEENWASPMTAEILHENGSDSLIPESINESTQTPRKDIQAHKAYIVNTHKG